MSMERVLDKLEKIEDRLDEIGKTLVKQEENLRLHMYRTELAEEALEHHSERLKPVEAHVSKISYAIGVAKWAAVVVVSSVSLLAAVVKILEYFKR